MSFLIAKQNKKVIKFYWRYLRKFKLQILFQVTIVVFLLLSKMYWSYLVGNIFDFLSLDLGKDIILNKVYHVIYFLIALEVMIIAFGFLTERSYSRISTKVLKKMYDDTFAYLQKHSFGFFNNHLSGALITQAQRLESSLEVILDIVFYSFLKLFWRILFTISVLFYFNWFLGLVVLIWLIVFLIINFLLAKYKVKFEEVMAKAQTRVGAELSESITGNVNLKLFNTFDYELKRFKQATSNKLKKVLEVWDLENLALTGQTAAMAFLEILTIYLTVKLWSEGAITLGIVYVIQSYVFSLYVSIWSFGNNLRRFFESLVSAQEMIDHLDTPYEVQDIVNAKNLRVIEGEIEFKNVSFAYEEKTKGVLRNFSLIVRSKQKVALVGPSGGGKSTVVKLLLRLFDVQKGQILIDDQDISKVTQGSLRKSIALVPQDPILFHRSVKENIAYGNSKASMEEIIKASKMAKCHDFIMKMPKKYNTLVGERGIKLSGGQKQRVAIARAILTKASILVFDEATSSLDSESELMINKAIEQISKDKTTIIIAHRLSTVMRADKIFVIENGRIIEDGNHKELLEKGSGLYKKLWDLQSGGFLEE